MFKVNNKNTKTTFYCVYWQLWTYITPCFSVFTVNFEQVNVCWVPPYQFINAEITYRCSYQQMCKNLSEIVAHKKRL